MFFGIAVEAQGSHSDVQVPGFFPGQFRYAAGSKKFGQLHLKEPVLGGHKSLGHQNIFRVLCINDK
jgi:hypothetical protein